jgi:hypothetical protein
MPLQFTGLPTTEFAHLFALPDAALALQGAVRVIADDNGYPCRVSLQRAQPGETLLLVHFEHHHTASPYRAAGPVYVRQLACETSTATTVVRDTLPAFLAGSLLSLRAYGADGMLCVAEVTPAEDALALITAYLARPDAAYVHIHFARPGCFACRVEKVAH